jgi:hypothetical protein
MVDFSSTNIWRDLLMIKSIIRDAKKMRPFFFRFIVFDFLQKEDVNEVLITQYFS